MRVFSIIEGTKESLQRLQLDYVDIIFAHRADTSGEYPNLPPRCREMTVD